MRDSLDSALWGKRPLVEDALDKAEKPEDYWLALKMRHSDGLNCVLHHVYRTHDGAVVFGALSKPTTMDDLK